VSTAPRAVILLQYLHRPIKNNINTEISFSEFQQPFMQHMFTGPFMSYILIRPDIVLQMCQTSRKYSPQAKQAVVLLASECPLMQTARYSLAARCFREMKCVLNSASTPNTALQLQPLLTLSCIRQPALQNKQQGRKKQLIQKVRRKAKTRRGGRKKKKGRATLFV